MKKFAILGFFLTFCVFSRGSDITVFGRNYTFSCGYFTSVQADVKVTFHDMNLPEGSQVTLMTGWSGRQGFPETRFEWQEKETLMMKASSPQTWSATLTKVLHERTEAKFRDTLNFVFRVAVPGKQPFFLTGKNDETFYSVRLVENSPGRCVHGLDDLPEFAELVVQTKFKEQNLN